MTFSNFCNKLEVIILIFLCLFYINERAYGVITASPSEITIDLKGRQQERYSEWSVQYNGKTNNKASFDFFSSNSRVADVQGDNIIGLKEGVAYITISMSGTSDTGEILVKVVDSHKDPSVLETSIKPIKSDIITHLPTISTPRPITTAPVTTPTTTLKPTPVITATPKVTNTPTPTKVVITKTPTPTKVVATKTPTPTKTIATTKVPATTIIKTTSAPVVTKAPTKAPTKRPTKVPTKVPTKAPTPVPTPVPTPTPLPVPADFKGVRIVETNNLISIVTTEKYTLACETWFNSNVLNNNNYSYYSLNEKVAKVSNTGVITGVAEGTTTIYVFAPTYMDIGVEQAKKDINKNGSVKERNKIK